MSSDLPSDAPSSGPDDDARDAAPGPGPAELIRERGAPLLGALEQRLPGSRRHGDGTASWALAAAAELGLDRNACLAVREAARLHEVGKIYVEKALLDAAPEGLSAEELAQLDSYATHGERLARGAEIPDAACEWLRHSRERVDGRGAPSGLSGEEIPLPSRVIRAACALDLLLADESDREKALAKLREAAGAELDPAVVEALARVLRQAAASSPESA